MVARFQRADSIRHVRVAYGPQAGRQLQQLPVAGPPDVGTEVGDVGLVVGEDRTPGSGDRLGELLGREEAPVGPVQRDVAQRDAGHHERGHPYRR